MQRVHFVEYKSYLNIFDFLKTREKKTEKFQLEKRKERRRKGIRRGREGRRGRKTETERIRHKLQ